MPFRRQVRASGVFLRKGRSPSPNSFIRLPVPATRAFFLTLDLYARQVCRARAAQISGWTLSQFRTAGPAPRWIPSTNMVAAPVPRVS